MSQFPQHPLQNSGVVFLTSGAVRSGHIAGVMRSGNYSSGAIQYRCSVCGASNYYYNTITVPRSGSIYTLKHYCLSCAGYETDKGFTRPFDFIMESTPLISGTPLEIVADWLEENRRPLASEWIRNLKQVSGNVIL